MPLLVPVGAELGPEVIDRADGRLPPPETMEKLVDASRRRSAVYDMFTATTPVSIDVAS